MNTTPTDLAAQARKHADKISAGITMGHDWPNTQDELDRLNAAECLRQCAQELERKPLTDEQIDSAWRSACERHELTRDIVRDFARAIDAAHASGAKGGA